jgi:hypothetical protein
LQHKENTVLKEGINKKENHEADDGQRRAAHSAPGKEGQK